MIVSVECNAIAAGPCIKSKEFLASFRVPEFVTVGQACPIVTKGNAKAAIAFDAIQFLTGRNVPHPHLVNRLVGSTCQTFAVGAEGYTLPTALIGADFLAG